MKAVAAGDEIALDLFRRAVTREGDARALALHVVDRDIAHFEMDHPAGGKARGDDVLHRFLLAIDGDLLAAGERREVDAMAAALEAQLDAGVDLALGPHPFAKTRLVEHVDAALFEHAGAHAVLDIIAAAVFQHDRFDSRLGQKVGEEQARRARSDDPDLCAHGHQNG